MKQLIDVLAATAIDPPALTRDARVMLVGLGPHARRIYAHYLATHGVGPHVVVDVMACRDEVLGFLDRRRIQTASCFVDPDDDTPDALGPANVARLDAAIAAQRITHVINSGASHTHLAYLKYFISRGLQVLTDKPITAPSHVITDPAMARQISDDYDELSRLYLPARARGARVEVQCQRRYHVGYLFIRSLIADLVRDYRIPITHVDLYHCDGMWNMPDEFLTRENHAYKYGYGKLFHSGYHFIDLLAWLLAAGRDVDPAKRADHAELYTAATLPADALTVIDQDDYSRLLGADHLGPAYRAAAQGQFARMGELDFHSILQLKRQDRTICTCDIALLQSGFSRRSWAQLPEDTYKGNGRIRHERVNIQIGPLANIQIHSYQAREVHERANDDTRLGEAEHFDIHIYRNVGLIGGAALETVSWRDLGAARERDGHFIGYNEQAKERCMMDFLSGTGKASDLSDHAASIQLLSQSYLSLAQRHQGLSPVVHFPLVA